jgi:hypothetical protein
MILETNSSSTFYALPSLNCSVLKAATSRKSTPVQTVEEIRGSRQIIVPVTKIVKTKVPITKAVTSQVPIKRAIRGTKDVVSHAVVNRQKVETYTKMVPVQATRIVNVPTLVKQVKKVPTINYVTDYVTKVDYVTEFKDEFNTITSFEQKTIPTIQKRIRTRYETIEDLPEQDIIC